MDVRKLLHPLGYPDECGATSGCCTPHSRLTSGLQLTGSGRLTAACMTSDCRGRFALLGSAASSQREARGASSTGVHDGIYHDT